MAKEVAERCFRALSCAIFVSHCLDLPAVKRASAGSMRSLTQAIAAMQQLCCIAETTSVLAWCQCMFSVSAKSYNEMDESTGDFVLPVPRPSVESFYVAPVAPRPLLELFDDWSQRRVSEMIDCFAVAMDFLMAVMEHTPEDELSHSAGSLHVAAPADFFMLLHATHFFTRGSNLQHLHAVMSNFMVVLLQHHHLRAMTYLDQFCSAARG